MSFFVSFLFGFGFWVLDGEAINIEPLADLSDGHFGPLDKPVSIPQRERAEQSLGNLVIDEHVIGIIAPDQDDYRKVGKGLHLKRRVRLLGHGKANHFFCQKGTEQTQADRNIAGLVGNDMFR